MGDNSTEHECSWEKLKNGYRKYLLGEKFKMSELCSALSINENETIGDIICSGLFKKIHHARKEKNSITPKNTIRVGRGRFGSKKAIIRSARLNPGNNEKDDGM